MSSINRRHIVVGGAAAGLVASTAVTGARAQTANTLKIGVVLPLSGPVAQPGNAVLVGAQVAADLMNKSGGIGGRAVELVIKDSKANPNAAVQATRELLSDGVKLIVGPLLTAELLAMLPVVDQAGGLLVTVSPSGMQVTHENFSRSMFRGHSQDYMDGKAMAYFAAERYPRTVNWVNGIVDTQALRAGAKIFTHFLQEAHEARNRKASFIEDVAVAAGSTDMRSQISAIAGSPTQGMYDVVFGQAGVTFWQQAAPFGLQKKLDVVIARSSDPTIWKALKRNVPQNLWVSQWWWPDAYKNVPESVQHFTEFKSRTKEDLPPSNFWSGATAVHTFAAAIKAAGGSTDPKQLVTVLESGLKVPTVRGPMQYRKEDHQLLCPIDLIKVEITDNEPGYKVTDFVSLEGAKFIDPAGPGTPFKL